jgi:hypothetical protein
VCPLIQYDTCSFMKQSDRSSWENAICSWKELVQYYCHNPGKSRNAKAHTHKKHMVQRTRFHWNFSMFWKKISMKNNNEYKPVRTVTWIQGSTET